MFNWIKTAALMAAITALFGVQFLRLLVLGQDGAEDVSRP